MIEGMKIDISTGELRDLLIKRADDLAKKATLFETKGGEMQEAMSELEEEESVKFTAANVNPAKAAKTVARSYRAEEKNLRFVAAHLVEGETYRLDPQYSLGGHGGIIAALLAA